QNYWLDLWQYRELFLILAWRDIAIRYKQTLIGVSWTLIQPLLTMLIMTIIFGKIAGLPSEEGVPYAIMVFAALLPWQLFAGSLSNSSLSLVNNAHIVSKVYFPRLIIPGASIMVSLLDFLISFLILGGLMVWFSYLPPVRVFCLPLFIMLTLLTAWGPGLLLTSLNVHFRDVRHLIPFIVQFGLYVSPVGFSSSLVLEKFGPTLYNLYCLNPMVGAIDGFRWCLLDGSQPFPWAATLSSLVSSSIFMVLGIICFRKTEKRFADKI
ncbi:MAG: ABC transporter permease, partial [Verrucomicrobiota bacterium]